MKRLKILISAYACEPGKGSEPGVGWNIAKHMARYHDVWVLTRKSNAPAIEADLLNDPCSNLHFLFYDLPGWVRWWKKGARGVQLYYYLWQIGIYFIARRCNRELRFDVIHHATFVKYWAPSFLSLLPVPFVWGPVGGGESAPRQFWKDFHIKGNLYERMRNMARWLGEHDPFVRSTARHSSLALATTRETADRLSLLGLKRIKVVGESSLSKVDLQQLPAPAPSHGSPFRFISISRLLHWKGIHLGLRAFAQANIPSSEFWIVGDGPDRQRLETLARDLSISDRVQLWGSLSRHETMGKLRQCHVLVHPSLHDSGGWVCLESMAMGRPVICLDLGGPGGQVTQETGFKIAPRSPAQAVSDIANAMKSLFLDRDLLARMGQAGQERIRQEYTWDRKAEELNTIYEEVVRHR